jgi:hypothetical protein
MRRMTHALLAFAAAISGLIVVSRPDLSRAATLAECRKSCEVRTYTAACVRAGGRRAACRAALLELCQEVPPFPCPTAAQPPFTTGIEARCNAFVVGATCDPSVHAEDPLQIEATLTVKNVSLGFPPVGPIVVTDASLRDPAGDLRATFDVQAAPIPVLPIGRSGTTIVGKVPGSLLTKNGCGVCTLVASGACGAPLCGAPVILDLGYSGPGIPSGSHVPCVAMMGCLLSIE